MDSKKKRNKKKKGNQAKNGDETTSNIEEVVVQEHGNGSAVVERSQNGKVVVSTEGAPLVEQDKEPLPEKQQQQQTIQNGSVRSEASLSEQHKEPNGKWPLQNGTASVSSPVPEPDREMDKHNMCEEKFVKLQETVTKLEEERDSWLKKVTTLEDRLLKMQDKVDTYVQNELSLEDKLSKMQNKVDMYTQNEVHLGRKLQIFQNENDMLAKKQVSLEDKFERIEDMKYSWSLKEGSLNATITRLEEVNRVLQLRVMALEQSTDNTGQKYCELIESLSSVESRIETLEAKCVQHNPSDEAAKLMAEKSSMIITQPADEPFNQHTSHFVDPFKTVNEADMKQNELINDFSNSDVIQERHLNISSPSVETINENSENLLRDGQAMHYPGNLPINAGSSNDTTITVDIDQVQKLELHLPSVSEETVHPLQDVEINEEHVVSSDETSREVPLTDAPLIGAPFRLFSFVAKFVAGSDLVNQTNLKSGN